MFWFRVAGIVVGVLGGWGLREIYYRTTEWKKRYRVLLVLVASYLMAIPLTVSTNLVLASLYLNDNDFAGSVTLFRQQWVYFYHFLIWSIFYFSLVFYRDVALLKQSELSARMLARDAQLKMLRYQLNPHFLFNTLNAISTLILEKETKPANDMVIRLSEFLRHSLVNDPMKQVTLEQEITSLQLYLGIEKARFEDRLNVRFDVEPSALDALLPSLLLQPLVENAIKYAVSPSMDGGTITVSARVFAGQLLVEVLDDGPGCENVAVAGCGVGLANCTERLQAVYGSDFSFSFGNRGGDSSAQGFEVCLRLPLNTDEVKDQNREAESESKNGR